MRVMSNTRASRQPIGARLHPCGVQGPLPLQHGAEGSGRNMGSRNADRPALGLWVSAHIVRRITRGATGDVLRAIDPPLTSTTSVHMK